MSRDTLTRRGGPIPRNATEPEPNRVGSAGDWRQAFKNYEARTGKAITWKNKWRIK